jgi:hypothetical protein
MSQSRNILGVLIYFSCIGIGFMLVEIPLIQRSILLLGHPAYAFTLVVLVLLLASSYGSLLSRRSKSFLIRELLYLVGCILVTIGILEILTELALGWTVLPKSFILAISLVPLGILMGIPFPAGLKYLAGDNSQLITWAWAINGCASVIASVLAAILVLSYGFNLVPVLGMGFYLVATFVMLKADSRFIVINVRP